MMNFIILALSMDQIEQAIGINIVKTFGGGTTGIYLMGLFFLIAMFFFFIKMGVGFEGSIILGIFGLYGITQGLGSGSGQANLLPMGFMVVIMFLVGWVVYLAFIKRDVLGGQ